MCGNITDEFMCSGADLEPGPECEVDAIQVVIQAGYAPLVHDELVVVINANHEQQAQDVPCFLHCTSADTNQASACQLVCSAVYRAIAGDLKSEKSSA